MQRWLDRLQGPKYTPLPTNVPPSSSDSSSSFAARTSTGVTPSLPVASPSTTNNQNDPSKPSCFHTSGSIILLVSCAVGMLVLCREYLGLLIVWLAQLSGLAGPLFFLFLFILSSLPMMWGYMVLNLGAGYLYGMWLGLLVTAVGASLGALVAFLICRFLWKDYVTQKISHYENLQQIVRVIEGKHGFRLIMMTRLTPIPFGLQNALLSTAKVTKVRYTLATALGLLPTQILNTYMGTTLRTMEDVLAGKNDNVFVIVAQVAVALIVSYLVNQKMRAEINKAVAAQQLSDVRPGESAEAIELQSVHTEIEPQSPRTSASSLTLTNTTRMSPHDRDQATTTL
eukprot:m.233434 g.233434  ORF g.233434 m.233434 type:complete len:341 (+) comp19135_c0_seq1:147-1169(+)